MHDAGDVACGNSGHAGTTYHESNHKSSDSVDMEALVELPIQVRSRFGTRKFRTLTVGSGLLTYGRIVLPFERIEWAIPTVVPNRSCSTMPPGDETHQMWCLLVKEPSRSKPHALIFATVEQRDLVTQRLAEWNPGSLDDNQPHVRNGGSRCHSAHERYQSECRDSLVRLDGAGEMAGGDEYSAPGRSASSRHIRTPGRSASRNGSAHHEQASSGFQWARHLSSPSSDDGDGLEPPFAPSCCCCDFRRGGCDCRYRCLAVRMDGCSDASSSCAETSITTAMGFLRTRVLELCIFGLLMPLFLAFALQLWQRQESDVYNQPWKPATCHIESLTIANSRLYMHGDYLRNDHPNDGVYYVLQPEWTSTVTPIPQHAAETRERVSCCRQSHADAVIPSGLKHLQTRTPLESWHGIVVDEILRIDSEKCEGPIGYTLQETIATCQKDMSWTLPDRVKLNGTYPCWYVAHGSTHVYLNVEPPRLELFTSDVLTAVLAILALASATALILTHTAIQTRLGACLPPSAATIGDGYASAYCLSPKAAMRHPHPTPGGAVRVQSAEQQRGTPLF